MKSGGFALILPFLSAVSTTPFNNIFLLFFLHLCFWCFATDLPWRDLVKLKSLIIMNCFGNRKYCFSANSDAPRNCSMHKQSKKHVVRIPYGALDQSGLPLTSG